MSGNMKKPEKKLTETSWVFLTVIYDCIQAEFYWRYGTLGKGDFLGPVFLGPA